MPQMFGKKLWMPFGSLPYVGKKHLNAPVRTSNNRHIFDQYYKQQAEA
jgi:hypothetical protein